MNTNVILETMLLAKKAIVDHKNRVEYNEAWVKQCVEELKERADNNGGEITEDDVREVFGFGK
jgi:hypothetical protein|uniref:Uncharacterized protein n=2 Tax=unclassified Caudoviricetes TaxID=2788787 RepID=A0A8S5LTN4_9CAUD|nr:MAG TPA: hypothetical protein [Siphoviridae sp. ctKm44]DAE09879.1 MAG TPA: hypothetical protein [Siphoviridae sp. ctJdE31]